MEFLTLSEPAYPWQAENNARGYIMDQEKFIRHIEADAKLAGVTMGEVCKRAGVSASSPGRWKKPDGPRARYETLLKLRSAVDQFLRESEG